MQRSSGGIDRKGSGNEVRVPSVQDWIGGLLVVLGGGSPFITLVRVYEIVVPIRRLE